MKENIKRLAGCLVTVALIALGIHGLGILVRPLETDRAYRRIKVFHELPRDSVEVMIYGSSHAILGVRTMELYDRYGIGAYNYGTSWQKGNTVKLFLRDSLQTQSPRLAVIETYLVNNVLRDTDITGEIFLTSYLEDSPARREYLEQCFGSDPERWLSYYMPLCAFHENWNSLEQASFLPRAWSGERDSMEKVRKNMGFAWFNRKTPIEVPDPSTVKQKGLSEAALKELDDIMAICRERNIQVLFITVPYDEGYRYGDAMKAYARENGCGYLNFFELADEIGLDGNTDFWNGNHTNVNGATKVADYLGKYISEHYDLTDMRTVPGNLWDQANAMEIEGGPGND